MGISNCEMLPQPLNGGMPIRRVTGLGGQIPPSPRARDRQALEHLLKAVGWRARPGDRIEGWAPAQEAQAIIRS